MKYIIEIENEPFGRNDDPFFPHGMDELYRAKGFKSLVFDQNGLDKLTPYTEPDREAIENEVWEFVKTLGSISQYQRKEMFGDVAYWYVLDTFNYQEAKAKYDAWKKQKEDEEIKQKVIDLAEEIGIHKLYSIVREIRGE